MEQLIINRPSDPIAFLIEMLKLDNNDGNAMFYFLINIFAHKFIVLIFKIISY